MYPSIKRLWRHMELQISPADAGILRNALIVGGTHRTSSVEGMDSLHIGLVPDSVWTLLLIFMLSSNYGGEPFSCYQHAQLMNQFVVNEIHLSELLYPWTNKCEPYLKKAITNAILIPLYFIPTKWKTRVTIITNGNLFHKTYPLSIFLALLTLNFG